MIREERVRYVDEDRSPGEITRFISFSHFKKNRSDVIRTI